MPRAIALRLEDSPFSTLEWSPAHAQRAIIAAGHTTAEIEALAVATRQSLAPCERTWLKQRLTVMALAFGHERDPDRATAWLSETIRLLADLPADILSDAIDIAIKESERGFMPSVGTIRAIGDPMRAKRQLHAGRLERLAALDRAAVAPVQPATAVSTGADDMIEPGEVERANGLMRKFGLNSRYAPDGSHFLLKPGDEDTAP